MSQVQIMQQRVLDGFAALPPRDRFLAVGLLVCTFFGGLGFGMHTMKQSLAAAKDEVSRLEQSLQLIQVLQTEQANLEAEVTAIEDALAKCHNGLVCFLRTVRNKSRVQPQKKNMQVRKKSSSKRWSTARKKYFLSVYPVSLRRICAISVSNRDFRISTTDSNQYGQNSETQR